MKTPMLDKIVERAKDQVDILALKGDLDKLVKECEACTRTNCGWQQYHMADIVVDYARYLRALRDKEDCK